MASSSKKMNNQCPSGWHIESSNPNFYTVGIGDSNTENENVLFIDSTDAKPSDFETVMQSFGAINYQSKKVKFSGYLRFENVHQGCGLFLRVMTIDRKELVFDKMKDRELKGTSKELKYCELVVEIPTVAEYIRIGTFIRGAGRVEVQQLQFQEVCESEKVTSSPTKYSSLSNIIQQNTEPKNLELKNFQDGLFDEWQLASGSKNLLSSKRIDEDDRDRTSIGMIENLDQNTKGQTLFSQKISADKYKRGNIKFSAELKATNVTKKAALFLRADTASPGSYLLCLHDMSDRYLRDSTRWKESEIVINIPDSAQTITFGIYLDGTGKVEFRNLTLALDEADAKLTNTYSRHKKSEPTNLKLETRLD